MSVKQIIFIYNLEKIPMTDFLYHVKLTHFPDPKSWIIMCDLSPCHFVLSYLYLVFTPPQISWLFWYESLCGCQWETWIHWDLQDHKELTWCQPPELPIHIPLLVLDGPRWMHRDLLHCGHINPWGCQGHLSSSCFRGVNDTIMGHSWCQSELDARNATASERLSRLHWLFPTSRFFLTRNIGIYCSYVGIPYQTYNERNISFVCLYLFDYEL